VYLVEGCGENRGRAQVAGAEESAKNRIRRVMPPESVEKSQKKRGKKCPEKPDERGKGGGEQGRIPLLIKRRNIILKGDYVLRISMMIGIDADGSMYRDNRCEYLHTMV
jgi:hypothetical protein